jgi:hypothetical protein
MMNRTLIKEEKWWSRWTILGFGMDAEELISDEYLYLLDQEI